MQLIMMKQGKRTKELIRRFGAEKCKIIDFGE
jgi:hypothetical protein